MRDGEAEAFINNAVKAQPYAPYLLAQTVIVQEETLKGAAQKIEELETRLREAEARAAAPAAQAGGGFLGGFGRSIFGGAEPPRPAAPRRPRPVKERAVILEIPFIYTARVVLPRRRNEEDIKVVARVPMRVREIPGEEAFRPMDQGGCPLVK